MRAWMWLGLLVTACGSGGQAPEEAEEEAPPAHVRCEAVRSATVDDAVTLRGQVAPPPLAEAVVASPVPGRIARLLVAEGDHVEAGQLVASIEDPTLGASAAETGADVDAARVELRSG